MTGGLRPKSRHSTRSHGRREKGKEPSYSPTPGVRRADGRWKLEAHQVWDSWSTSFLRDRPQIDQTLS
jgi:hypothetical protein